MKISEIDMELKQLLINSLETQKNRSERMIYLYIAAAIVLGVLGVLILGMAIAFSIMLAGYAILYILSCYSLFITALFILVAGVEYNALKMIKKQIEALEHL